MANQLAQRVSKTHRRKRSAGRSLVAIAAGTITGCVPLPVGTVVTRPQGPTDLSVTASTETPNVFEASTITLGASATGGSAPYMFRWNLNAGPSQVELGDAQSDTLSPSRLDMPGRYVFRVVVTDSAGFTATDFVPVTVLAAVTAEAPALITVGEPAQLSATIDPAAGDVALLWDVVRGSATFDDPSLENPRITAAAGETIDVELSITLNPGSAEPGTTIRRFEIASILDNHPEVRVQTSLGDFAIELDAVAAPKHTANFLLYVDDGFYDGLLIHRISCSVESELGACDPFVVQGGGYRRVDGELELVEPTRDPVESESDNGFSNGELYSVALALSGNDPDSGTTQFFINLADNSFLDNQGFTVFGSVVDGREIIDEIVAVERTDSSIVPNEVSLPVDDVVIPTMRRVDTN